MPWEVFGLRDIGHHDGKRSDGSVSARELQEAIHGIGRPKGQPMKRLARLSLFAVPGCPPCEIVKAALSDTMLAELGMPRLYVAGIEEARALRRKQEERVIYPTLLLEIGGTIVARRVGATSACAEQERQHISGWLTTHLGADACGKAKGGGDTLVATASTDAREQQAAGLQIVRNRSGA